MLLIERTSHDDLKVRFRNLTRLTAEKASRLNEDIAGYIESPCRCLNLDMEGIHFIDAKSFDILVKLQHVLEERGIRLSLLNVSDEILELIDLMQLTGIFQIEPIQGKVHEVALANPYPLS
jgi:anti-anti-sigma factor